MEEPGWKQSNPGCGEKHIIVATHLSRIFIHSTETDGTHFYTRSTPLLLTLIACLCLCQIEMTTSGHCANTHGRTGYEPNLTDSQHMVA